MSCVLALVGSGLLLFRGTHRGTEVPTAAAAQVATTYAVDLQVTPSTSTIELDDAGVGQGRLVRTFARDAQKHRLRISAPGFEGVLVEFDETRPPPPAITLRAAAAAAAPATSTGAGAPPPVGAGGKRVAPTAPVGKTGAPAGRPKTDNIDPWE